MSGTVRGLAPAGRVLTLIVIMLTLSVAHAATPPAATDEVAKALNLWRTGEFDQSLAIATELLERDDLSKEDRIGVYSALSTIHFSMGSKHLEQAKTYLEKIRELGPCQSDLPFEFWAKPLREHWYRALQANNELACGSGEATDIQTVAIMEFDNYSTGKYQEELGFLAKGLSDAFEADFNALNGLKVVERDKIDFVLKEIMMAKDGLVDESTAVRAGKLLGAQIMIFGSVMQIDSKNARMLVKAVKVETSEILATAERKGKPDFFSMEAELVTDLAAKLDIAISPEAGRAMDSNGSTSPDAAGLYAKGLYYVDQYEYAKAYEFFKQAYALDTSYTEAKNKMDIYRPLATSS